MSKIRIFTDSCSDLGRDIREQFDIDYVKMCTVYQGKESPADLDWSTRSPRELYDIMRGGERVLTTQVPPEEFRSRFTEALEAGEQILYIGCALPLSSSVNTATVVARGLKEQYPDAVIHCVDATNSCLGEGLLAVMAAKLRAQGKGIDEIVQEIETRKRFVNQFVTVGSLDMLKKAGRVKGSAAFFGNLLGVKPIIISDYDGQNVPIVKVKGRKASLEEIVRLVRECVIDAPAQTLYVAHADCEEDAIYLRDRLMQECGFADSYVNYIGPIIGSCIGPGAVGAFVLGKAQEKTV